MVAGEEKLGWGSLATAATSQVNPAFPGSAACPLISMLPQENIARDVSRSGLVGICDRVGLIRLADQFQLVGIEPDVESLDHRSDLGDQVTGIEIVGDGPFGLSDFVQSDP